MHIKLLVAVGVIVTLGSPEVASGNPFTSPATPAVIASDHTSDHPQPATTCSTDTSPQPTINQRAVKRCVTRIAKHTCMALSFVTPEGQGWICKRRYYNLTPGWSRGACHFGPPLLRNVGQCYPYGTVRWRVKDVNRTYQWLTFTSWQHGGVTVVQRGTTLYIANYIWTFWVHGDVG